MHGAVMLNEQGSVVRPALIWCDVRTEKQCRDLTAKIGHERLIQLTCNPALANFTLTKTTVGARERTRKLETCSRGHASEGLRPLTPHRRTRHDMADAPARCFSTWPIAAGRGRCCRPPKSMKSRCLLFTNLPMSAEGVSSKGAAETSLRVGTPVVAGAGDQAAGAAALASSRLEPSAPPSAPPASFLPLPIAPRSILAVASTLSVMRFPDAGTSWA